VSSIIFNNYSSIIENLFSLVYNVDSLYLERRMNKSEEELTKIKLFAAKLTLIRLQKGFATYEELASEVGVHKSLIWDYEHAKKEPGFTMICRLCEALQVTPSELMCEKEIRELKKTN
jgi:ribosome-binding protein aMBF1 (putative translation factor)